MINTEERTLTASPYVAVYELTYSGACRSEHPSFVNLCFLKNEPIILCLTYFYFRRTVLVKKYLEEFDGKPIF